MIGIHMYSIRVNYFSEEVPHDVTTAHAHCIEEASIWVASCMSCIHYYNTFFLYKAYLIV
jgi:hypothetical protein